jgi:HEAT repeat protein
MRWIGAIACLGAATALAVAVGRRYRSAEAPNRRAWFAVESDPNPIRPARLSKAAAATMPAPEATSRANLESLLLRLDRASGSPATARQVLALVRGRRDEFRTPLLEILGDPGAPLLLPALELVALTGWSEHAPAIVSLPHRCPPALAAAAIRAGGRIDAFWDSTLRAFLNDADPLVLCATLEVVAGRDDRPFDRIVQLVAHSDATVRDAAILAVSPAIGPRELAILCRATAAAEGGVAVSLIQALAATGVPPAAEACLLEQLASPDWTVRRESLRALSRKGTALDDPAPVLRTLRNGDASVVERAEGFALLERTRTFPVAELEALLPNLHPVLRLGCARCLARAGSSRAIPALLELLTVREGPGVDDEDVACARLGARTVLTEIVGQDLGADPGPWRTALAAAPPLAPRTLASEPRTFW